MEYFYDQVFLFYSSEIQDISVLWFPLRFLIMFNKALPHLKVSHETGGNPGKELLKPQHQVCWYKCMEMPYCIRRCVSHLEQDFTLWSFNASES